jgi:hypothetical protein
VPERMLARMLACLNEQATSLSLQAFASLIDRFTHSALAKQRTRNGNVFFDPRFKDEDITQVCVPFLHCFCFFFCFCFCSALFCSARFVR